jgi:hypothetical protein
MLDAAKAIQKHIKGKKQSDLDKKQTISRWSDSRTALDWRSS